MKDTMIKYLVVTTFSAIELLLVILLYNSVDPESRVHFILYYFIFRINFSSLKG